MLIHGETHEKHERARKDSAARVEERMLVPCAWVLMVGKGLGILSLNAMEYAERDLMSWARSNAVGVSWESRGL